MVTSRASLVRRIAVFGSAGLALLATALPVATALPAAAAPPPTRGGPPAFVLQRDQHGEAAIRALGSRLPQVAAQNGVSAAELKRRLRSDQEQWVGRTGQLLFVDDHLEAAASVTAPEPVLASAPLTETFTLHSRPGAARVIFLDFDGFEAAGTAWDTGSNVTTAQPYSADADPTTFSDAERTTIQSIWQRVAEDYAPFDIDVTTQDPGAEAIRRSSSTDTAYGTRAVVTPTNVYACSCGGVAYVGTYDVYGTMSNGTPTHDYYQPAWIFTSGVGTGAKTIAEALSHEVGHNLGLNHDGTSTQGYYAGHGDWAPIMGVGYYKPITQFSAGEYTGANNTQDDFATIAANGGPLMADDHGNTAASATALVDPTVTASGLLHSRSDVDAFAFTSGGGAVAIAASPAAVSPDLDVRLSLLDAGGAELAVSDPDSSASSGSDTTAGMDASISTVVPAGSYVLLVEGVGAGDPLSTGYSDYASVGRYRLSGTVATDGNHAPVANAAITNGPGFVAPATIALSGAASTDADGDPLTYQWTLGGTTIAASATASYAASSAGTYTFTLTVSDGSLSSTDSVTATVTEPVPAAPSAPSSVTATLSSRTATVRWTDTATNETSFEVVREQRQKNGTWKATLVGTVGADTTSFTNSGLSRGATYRYKVRAVNSGGASAYVFSNQLTVPR